MTVCAAFSSDLAVRSQRRSENTYTYEFTASFFTYSDLLSTTELPSNDPHETSSMQPPSAQQTPNTTKLGGPTTVVGKNGESNRDQKILKPVVSFSGLAADERDQYAAIVTDLGGEVDNQLTLGEKATHLIVHTPSEFGY